MALHHVDLHGFHEPLLSHRISKTNKQSLRRTKCYTPAPTAALESVQMQAQHGGALTCPAIPVPGLHKRCLRAGCSNNHHIHLWAFCQQQPG